VGPSPLRHFVSQALIRNYGAESSLLEKMKRMDLDVREAEVRSSRA
jgi:hypothetical protein